VFLRSLETNDPLATVDLPPHVGISFAYIVDDLDPITGEFILKVSAVEFGEKAPEFSVDLL
jgi:hypothetical protein